MLVALLGAASADAQPRSHGAGSAAPVPAAGARCSGVICVDTLVTDGRVGLRVSNIGTEARVVRLWVGLRGYTATPTSIVTVGVGPGEAVTPMVLVPSEMPAASAAAGAPPGRTYRYRFEAQRPFEVACRLGVCIRSERTERALTISVHNRLAVPVRVLPVLETLTPDTVRVEARSVRVVHAAHPRAVLGRYGIAYLAPVDLPDTTVAYRLPLDRALVESTGLPADILARYVRDTSEAARRTVRQNRYVYTLHTDVGADVRAARSGIVVDVADSLRDVAIDLSPGPLPLDSLEYVENRDGVRVEVRRRLVGGVNSLFVRHDDGTTARYLGLARGSAAVAVGDTVSVGTRLGSVGADARLSFSVVEFSPLQTTIPVWVQTRGQAARRLRERETVQRDGD